MAEIKNAAVVGGGTMGSGIVHVLAASGIEVTLIEVRKELLDKALASIKTNLERQAAKGTINREAVAKALERIHPATELKGAEGAQIVVEAVPEILSLKIEIFRSLDSICPSGTILASNTSSLPVTALGAATKRADKVVGVHFMNPVPVMKLVELIRGIATSDETFETAKALVVKLGKTPACSKDYPGFLSNRILMPMINEAVYALMEGVGAKEDIDTVMKLGMAHPMGPLTLADLIGLDVCLAVMEALHEGFADSKYRPCPLLRKMVEAGRLGRKSGEGFYKY